MQPVQEYIDMLSSHKSWQAFIGQGFVIDAHKALKNLRQKMFLP